MILICIRMTNMARMRSLNDQRLCVDGKQHMCGYSRGISHRIAAGIVVLLSLFSEIQSDSMP